MASKDPFAHPDALMDAIAALNNPHRLRILATLHEGRMYVSELARELGIGRPLLHMHLEKLESAGLVESSYEIASDGKTNRYCQAVPFELGLDLPRIARTMKNWSEKQ